AGLVGVVGEEDASRLLRLERRQVIIGEALGSPDASDVAKASAPERESIDHAFGEDDFRRLEGLCVEEAAMRPWQVKVIDPALLLAHPAAVNCRGLAFLVYDREDDGPVEVLVSGFPILAELRQPDAYFGAVLAVLVLQ